MILHGNQRGGGKDLAQHLMKVENETVQVFDVRGFISTDVMGAFTESYAMSRATKCKQHLYSLSLNPPKDEAVSDKEFVDAIALAEKRLGLDKQPRVIVFHEKYGSDGKLRKHAHAVWSRIDTTRMKAVQLSFTKQKLQDVSRELYVSHGWRMPNGFLNSKLRDPRNFSLAEWQQAKRQGKDPKLLKALFQERWSTSDSVSGFKHALEEQGFILARGDRRGFVAVDFKGEVYSISRWVGVKAKAVRDKLGEPESLPSVQQAHAKAAKMAADRLRQLRDVQHLKRKRFSDVFNLQKNNHSAKLASEQRNLAALQAQRNKVEDAIRAARIRKGIIGLWDRLNGRRSKMEAINTNELHTALTRDVNERRTLAAKFDASVQSTEAKAIKRQTDLRAVESEISADIQWLEKPSAIDAAAPDTSSRREQESIQARSRDGPEPSPF